MKGKVAIVTGAGSGIGRATAVLFAREGAAAVVVADVDASGGEETVRQVEAAGGVAAFVTTDVSRSAEVDNLVNVTVQRFGKLDVIVNNAYWGVLDKAVADTSDDDWTRTIDVTLRGAFNGCRAAIPSMIALGGGTIVNLSSIAATKSAPRFAAYSAAKGGIGALTKSVAVDYGRFQIRANAVAPGTVETPATAALLVDADRRQQLANKTLLGRIGQPDDIALAVLFLASDESSFITGQVLAVDGGRTIS